MHARVRMRIAPGFTGEIVSHRAMCDGRVIFLAHIEESNLLRGRAGDGKPNRIPIPSRRNMRAR